MHRPAQTSRMGDGQKAVVTRRPVLDSSGETPEIGAYRSGYLRLCDWSTAAGAHSPSHRLVRSYPLGLIGAGHQQAWEAGAVADDPTESRRRVRRLETALAR